MPIGSRLASLPMPIAKGGSSWCCVLMLLVDGVLPVPNNTSYGELCISAPL